MRYFCNWKGKLVPFLKLLLYRGSPFDGYIQIKKNVDWFSTLSSSSSGWKPSKFSTVIYSVKIINDHQGSSMKKLNQRNSCLVTSVTCLRREFWCLLKNKIEQERSWKRFLLQLKNHYWMKKWSQTFYAFFKMASYEGCFW